MTFSDLKYEPGNSSGPLISEKVKIDQCENYTKIIEQTLMYSFIDIP